MHYENMAKVTNLENIKKNCLAEKKLSFSS
jgi:hypothetical protein